MAGNKKITELAAIPNPIAGLLYITKDSADYKVEAGGANGIATLGADSKLPASQMSAHTHVVTDITNLSSYTGFDARYYTESESNALLAAKQPLDADLTSIAGLSGTTGFLKKTALNTWTLDTATYVPITGDGASGTWSISITGSAATLTTARTISLSGDVIGSVSFNGGSDVTLVATVLDNSHSHLISNVAGLQTTLDSKVTNGGSVATIVKLTQAEYTALGVKDANTLYVIVG